MMAQTMIKAASEKKVRPTRAALIRRRRSSPSRACFRSSLVACSDIIVAVPKRRTARGTGTHEMANNSAQSVLAVSKIYGLHFGKRFGREWGKSEKIHGKVDTFGVNSRSTSVAPAVAITVTVPRPSRLRRVGIGGALTPVPFDPDIDAIIASVEALAPDMVSVKREDDAPNQKGTLKRVEYPAGIRAVAQHELQSCVVEESQTEAMRGRLRGSVCVNPCPSYRPDVSQHLHVCVSDNMDSRNAKASNRLRGNL